MRKLVVVLCSILALAAASSAASAGGQAAGTLSVERGKGVVMIDLRGSVLGKLTTGSLRVTDTTPNDRYAALVVGRKVTQERMGPRTVRLPRSGPSFPACSVAGTGWSRAARGSRSRRSGAAFVTLDGDPRYAGDDTGVYSLDGVDCSAEPLSCVRSARRSPNGSRSRHRRSEPARSGGSAVTTPSTILVVEDETSIASFVAAYLRNAGYGVKTAAIGAGGARSSSPANRPRS